MKKNFILIALSFFCFNQLNAQKVYTKNGSVSFFSKAPVENIKADNNQAMSVLNIQTGEIQFSVLIKGFHFKKSLMEEHFNENYMESDKYPNATFKGTIDNFQSSNFTKDGNYTISVSGNLTIHGVTKKINAAGSLIITAGVITASSKFSIRLADYNISIPSIVKDNIAENIDITISSLYDKKI